MNNEKKTYNEVEDGVYDCVIVSAKRADGEKAIKHFIVSLGIRKADDEDAAAYWCNLPLCFGEGETWNFFDSVRKINAARPATVADTTAAWEHARKCFPDWAKYCDELDEEAGLKAAIEWFGSDASKEVVVRAKLTNRDGEDAKGNPTRKHYASIYEAKTGVVVDDDDNTRFEKALAASGVMIGRKAAKAAREKEKVEGEERKKAVPPSPAKKNPPKPGKFTSDDSWKAYEEGQKKVDPDGTHYWDRVAEITGKDAADWETFTSEDWRKCCDAFLS